MSDECRLKSVLYLLKTVFYLLKLPVAHNVSPNDRPRLNCKFERTFKEAAVPGFKTIGRKSPAWTKGNSDKFLVYLLFMRIEQILCTLWAHLIYP
jgi:hypothetical protein